MPAPLASEGVPAPSESQHQRKVGSTPPDPTFFLSSNVPWEPYPTLCSCLHLFSTSRAKPLILLKDLHLWLQRTALATCNLPSQCASFQRTARVSRDGRAIAREARWHSGNRLQPGSWANLGSDGASLYPLRLQRGGNNCIYHAERL